MTARGNTMLVTNELYVEECCNCGIVFGMPIEFQQQCRDKPGINVGKAFFCPNGHQQWYMGKTEAQRLRERLEAEQRRAANTEESLRIERSAHSATKGALTKTRKRVANGVCPCCKRSFVNMRRHMDGQHPGYVAQEA